MWNSWQGTAAEWDELLARFPDCSVYQTHGWGVHKSHFGWRPHRLVATNHGETVAMAQLLARRTRLGVALGWMPGGPIGAINTLDTSFRKALVQAVGVPFLYCRINRMCDHSVEDETRMRSLGWQRPSHSLLSGQSVLLSLELDENEWLRSIDKKHRYYVKKSAGAGITWAAGDTEELRRDLAQLTAQLSEEKGMALQERSAAALEDLSREMPGAVEILVGRLDSEAVTGCMVLKCAGKAIYATAATVGRGRETSAAYIMLAKLRGHLREQGVKLLDFGGINPASEKARGVDHFKRGFGGSDVRYCGEWDWAAVPGLRWAANLLIKHRAGTV